MNKTITSRVVPTWVRLAMVALAIPSLLAGVWAVISPQGWFDDFPGFDPRLVAAEPPFNEHLVTDAGAGLLASALVLLLGALLSDSRSVRLALIANAAFVIPHSGWHTFNPADSLTDAQNLQNAGTLAFNAVAVIVLYVVVSRADQETSSDSATTDRVEVSA